MIPPLVTGLLQKGRLAKINGDPFGLFFTQSRRKLRVWQSVCAMLGIRARLPRLNED